jgi:putative serine protease PepD
MSLPPIDDGSAGDDDADADPGAPPHPMDRIWRHPSELPIMSEPARRESRGGPTVFRAVLGPLGAGAIGALLTVVVLAAAGAFDPRSTTTSTTQTSGRAQASDVVATVTKRIAPAIVAVRVRSKTGSRTGSGVCIRQAGQVLTSNRLIADATSIEVVTSTGTVRTAKVMGRDPASDLALLEVPGDLDAADLASPNGLRIGDPVYAVGADGSGTRWVSAGIVSSLNGTVADADTTMSGLIESNIPIDSFIAGGALLDTQGRVAGILMTPSAGHPATIAVPIALASKVADGLRVYGRVDHGWLGLAGKVTTHGQVVITALAAGGPAEQAGIEVGDIVVTVDSQPISSMNEIMAAARGHWPGDRIPVEVTRDRSDLTVAVRLAVKPRAPAEPATTAPPTTTLVSASKLYS